MIAYLENVDITSTSGPNSFARHLTRELARRGDSVTFSRGDPHDTQLTFIQTSGRSRATKKHVLRLDGIYFNSRMDCQTMNAGIEASYAAVDSVVFQTEFNRRLTEKYFGRHPDPHVIRNATDLTAIRRIDPDPSLKRFDRKLWCASSHWRPHKRLLDDVRYFEAMSPSDHVMLVLGAPPNNVVEYVRRYSLKDRVIFLGSLGWSDCISVYRSCDTFVHLAYIDHCPNVVVDARACGCKIVVASSGGTREIAGLGATVVQDEEWDLSPIDHYAPPPLDFSRTSTNDIDSSVDIVQAVDRYVTVITP